MICVKVDKASRSASPLRSQCPPARRPPTLRNSYITITSCTYHNIRSRASDPSAPQSVTPPPCPPPRPTRTVRRRPSAQLYISIGRSAIRTRVGEEGVDDDLSKATSRLDDFQFIYTKRGRPSSLRWSLFFCPLFGITRHSRGSARSFTRLPQSRRPSARGQMRETPPRAPPCWSLPPASPRHLEIK